MASWLPRVRILIQFKQAQPASEAEYNFTREIFRLHFISATKWKWSRGSALLTKKWVHNLHYPLAKLNMEPDSHIRRLSYFRANKFAKICRRPWNPQRTSVAICCANPSIACEMGFDLTPFLPSSVIQSPSTHIWRQIWDLFDIILRRRVRLTLQLNGYGPSLPTPLSVARFEASI